MQVKTKSDHNQLSKYKHIMYKFVKCKAYQHSTYNRQLTLNSQSSLTGRSWIQKLRSRYWHTAKLFQVRILTNKNLLILENVRKMLQPQLTRATRASPFVFSSYRILRRFYFVCLSIGTNTYTNLRKIPILPG